MCCVLCTGQLSGLPAGVAGRSPVTGWVCVAADGAHNAHVVLVFGRRGTGFPSTVSSLGQQSAAGGRCGVLRQLVCAASRLLRFLAFYL